MDDLALIKSNWAIITAFVGIVAQWVWFKFSINSQAVSICDLKQQLTEHLKNEAVRENDINIKLAEISKDIFYIRQKLDEK